MKLCVCRISDVWCVLVFHTVAKLLSEKASLEGTLSALNARSEDIAHKLESRERELEDMTRHSEVEKRVFLEKIRSLETKDANSAAQVLELTAQLEVLKQELSSVGSDKQALGTVLEQLKIRKSALEEQV